MRYPYDTTCLHHGSYPIDAVGGSEDDAIDPNEPHDTEPAPPLVNPFQASAGAFSHRVRTCSWALSIRQPYPEEIARGDKTHEYRSWQTDYRGPLLVISGLRPDPDYPEARSLPRGVAICLVDIVGMDGSPGDWAWRLAHPVRVRPFPVKGKLGLIRMTDELRRQIRPA